MMPASQLALERAEPVAPAPTDQNANLVLMFERLATNPDVDVAKLERLIAMQERILAHNAEAAFNSAFAVMQAQIPTITEKGVTNNGKYAKLEDIVDVVRPILSLHGFSLGFRTEWPDKATVRVIGILTHRDGHSRQSEFLSSADSSGNKNAIQGLGSAVSYGHRYTTKDLLNITSRGEDDNGQATGRSTAPAPAGYDDWLTDLTAAADTGYAALEKAFKASKPEFRDYCTKRDAISLAKLKTKARGVK